MLKVTLILFAAVVVAMATASPQLGDDDVLGDGDVENSVVDVTYVLKDEGIIVNIPGDQEVCHVHQLQQQITDDVEERMTCSERVAMTDEELSPRLREICLGKAVFAAKYGPCHPRYRRRGCGYGVGGCWPRPTFRPTYMPRTWSTFRPTYFPRPRPTRRPRW